MILFLNKFSKLCLKKSIVSSITITYRSFIADNYNATNCQTHSTGALRFLFCPFYSSLILISDYVPSLQMVSAIIHKGPQKIAEKCVNRYDKTLLDCLEITVYESQGEKTRRLPRCCFPSKFPWQWKCFRIYNGHPGWSCWGGRQSQRQRATQSIEAHSPSEKNVSDIIGICLI